MHTRFLTLIIPILVLIEAAQGQAKTSAQSDLIGYYYDMNGQMIDGYMDFNYQASNKLTVNNNLNTDLSPVRVYSKDGLKTNGFLKSSSQNDLVKFREHKEDKGGKILYPTTCKAYVIGIDSFVSIQNFDIQRKMGTLHVTQPDFVEVIDRFDGLTFFIHTSEAYQKDVFTYLFKSDSSSEIQSFPKKKSPFMEVAESVFGDSDFLMEAIRSEKYSEEDLPRLIKLLKYKRAYEQNERIYFNSSWEEMSNAQEFAYYAEITSVQDTVFHVAYYSKNDTKQYEGDFTSFYPPVIRGDLLYFYPDGTVRKRISYVKNKPETGFDYFPGGILHREYTFSEDDQVYVQVLDSKGQTLLDDAKNGQEVFFDPKEQREITYEYLNGKIIYAYYSDSNGNKTYQLCKQNARLNFPESIQSRLNKTVKYPDESVIHSQQGYAFVKCIIEPTGLVSSVEVVKSLNAECDSLLLAFMEETFTKKKKWWPAQIKGEFVRQELIVPVAFTIKIEKSHFYLFNNYYNSNIPNWMMMQNTINSINNSLPKF